MCVSRGVLKNKHKLASFLVLPRVWQRSKDAWKKAERNIAGLQNIQS